MNCVMSGHLKILDSVRTTKHIEFSFADGGRPRS